MARAPGTEFHEKLCEVTECCICAEIFTNPKLLPCVHTFCLDCLEKYGKDKKPGDQMACPLCRNEFVVPQEGLSKLPSNFFIGKIVEIGRLASVPAKEEVCDLCSEETAIAKMICIDCEQKLCGRCGKSHTKIKNCQNHQVLELGSQINVKELNFRDSFCEHHPKELIKMFCHDDNVAICLICCVESHQFHKCLNVDKASGEFTEQLRDDLRRVANRRLECEEILQKLEKLQIEFTDEVLKTEESIHQTGTKLKKLIDQHTEDLVENLRAIRDQNLKSFENTRQDVSRFRVMIDSYQSYCDGLLTRGSPVDICRAANQMHTRAIDLDKQPVNRGKDDFCCEIISFHSTNLEFLMQQRRSNNVVGEVRVAKAIPRIVRLDRHVENFAAAGSVSFEISESTCRVFAKNDAKSYLTEQLHRKGISASWSCNDRSVTVYALDDKDLKGAVEVLKREVVEVHVQLSEASEALVQSGPWKEFIESLRTDCKSLEVVVMGSIVVAACTRNLEGDVRKRLNGFIEKHAILQKNVPMDLGFVEVITNFMKDELKKIEAELEACSGGIGTSKNEPGFIIVGDESGVGKALNDLLKLTNDISAYYHDIDMPGIPAYFYSRHGREVLRGIQISHRVSIQLDNTQSRAKPQAIAGDGSESCRVEVRPGKFLILMRGDITKCRVDAIVNAANEDLKHYGGVAAAIAGAAGPILEEDCCFRIKLEGRLLPGQAWVTRAGKLPCKKVIHAVGPRWSGGKADEESTLALAVESSLNAADKEGLKSIAMPSISTGIFGFPLDRATDIIVDAVKNYLVENSSTTVREVFFIDSDLRAVASLDKKLRTIQIEIPNERTEGRRGRRVPERVPQIQHPPPNTKQGAGLGAKYMGHQEEGHPQHLSRIIFSIYALSKKAIDDVIKDIEEIINEYIIDNVLNSPQDQENIAKLNPEQVRRIKDMANIHAVQIEVETGRLKRIRIRGPPMEVTSVMDGIHNIFQEAQKKG